jgi:hypothetical protein
MPLILNGNGTISTSVNTGTSFTTSGYPLTPNRPACMICCQPSDINWPTGGIINYGYSGATKLFDTTNSFDMATSRYTAPVGGIYYLSCTANGNATSGVPRGYVRINGAYVGAGQIHLRGNSGLNNGDLDQRTMACTLRLNAGDYVDIYVNEGRFDTFGANYFTMFLIG